MLRAPDPANQVKSLQTQNLFFLRIYLFFRERGREGEREEEKHINVQEKHPWWLFLTRPQPGTWPTAQTCALTRNRSGNLLVHQQALNPRSHSSQGQTQNLNKILSSICTEGKEMRAYQPVAGQSQSNSLTHEITGFLHTQAPSSQVEAPVVSRGRGAS